jgi:hypothetical protein
MPRLVPQGTALRRSPPLLPDPIQLRWSFFPGSRWPPTGLHRAGCTRDDGRRPWLRTPSFARSASVRSHVAPPDSELRRQRARAQPAPEGDPDGVRKTEGRGAACGGDSRHRPAVAACACPFAAGFRAVFRRPSSRGPLFHLCFHQRIECVGPWAFFVGPYFHEYSQSDNPHRGPSHLSCPPLFAPGFAPFAARSLHHHKHHASITQVPRTHRRAYDAGTPLCAGSALGGRST